MARPEVRGTRYINNLQRWLFAGALAGIGSGVTALALRDSAWHGFAEYHDVLEVGHILVLLGLAFGMRAVFKTEAANRENLHAVVSNARDTIFTIDEAGILLSLNPAGERMFDRPVQSILGQSIHLLMPEFCLKAGADNAPRNLQASATGETKISYEVKGKRRNETTFPIGLTVSKMRGTRGNLFVGIARDITERKQIEMEFRESDRQLQGILDCAPLCISLKDLQGRYKWVNRRYLEIFNVHPEDVVGKTAREVFPYVADESEAYDREALASLAPEGGNEISIKINGETRTLLQTKFILKDVAGWPSEICGIASEITERKQMERSLEIHSKEMGRITKELRYSEQRLQVVLDTAATGIITIDETGIVESFNPSAEQIFGYAAEAVIGKNVRMLMPSPDQERHDDYLSLYRETGQGKIIGEGTEVEGRRKDGAVFPMHLSISEGVLDKSDKRLFTGIVTDITKRKQAEAALQAAKEAAEVAVRTKSEFLATMSHEIRTPMNGVIGMTGLLMGTDLDKEQLQYAETVRKSADCLLTIINDILDFSKLEAGKLELEVVDFDLVETVESIAELMGPQATGKGIDFVTFFASDVPKFVRGDPSRLRQILTNLAGNAVKFTKNGSVAISVNVVEESAEGFRMHFDVIDSGIGIPAEAQRHLFEKFTQADSSTTRRYGGTGLGLAICKQLTKLMEGEIDVDSVSGEGSRFWLDIPLGRQEGSKLQEVLPIEDLSGLRVLVVDDAELNRRIFRKQFESWGMNVTCAEGADGALAMLEQTVRKKKPFDLIVLDHMMPDVDGEELGKKIRKRQVFDKVKMILATSMGMREDSAYFQAIGFNSYLTKPVRQSVLFNTIAHLFGDPAAKEGPGKRKGRGGRREKEAEQPSRRLRILLAEDNQVNQLLASLMLQKKGHRVDAVSNGIEAVKAVQTIPYDLILMDVQMPEMGGLEATAKIRRLPGEVCHIPIIALTANAMKGDRESYLAAGMDDYVSKPIDEAVLMAALARWSAIKTDAKAPLAGRAGASRKA